MSTSTNETFAVIEWAKKASKDNEIVALFWKELCKAVRQNKDPSPSKVYDELRLYGGNTIANIFRDGKGVPYAEVAYDVANALRSWGEDRNYKEGDIVSCEKFVLDKMEVKSDDLDQIANSFSDKGKDKGIGKGVSQTVGAAVTRGVAQVVAQKAAEQAAKKAAEQAAKKAGEQAAKKVAEQAAKKAAEQAAKEVAKQVTSRIISAVNIILIGYTIVSIAGPARRVTIPGVTYVALLRKIYRATQAGL